ncbi:MAG TPA: threonine ammonia-lyase [Acidimicrobiia bacterium]|nr:threonine ammonia-lyase [Acidimicrobiia bacterium]
MSLAIGLDDVTAAAAVIADSVVRTPTAASQTLSEITGADVVLKFENLQFTASFKDRGAANFLAGLSAAERTRGVVAASAGNHAQGVAHHARRLAIPATIVMPADTPFSKLTRTELLGAHVVLHGADFTDALAEAQRIARDERRVFVPAFDDARIIAGQGTVALELLADAPDVEVIVVPVGGGGLIAGIAVAAKALRPDITIVGVQSETYPGMAAALASAPAPVGGSTIAEGIAVAEPGVLTRAIVRELVDDIVVVPEATIEAAIALCLEIEKVVVEGAGAATLAALLHEPARFVGRRVALVLSGGNIDLRVLGSVALRSLARSGRLVRLRVELPDRPGALATLTTTVGDQRANIVDVTHRRDLPGVALQRALVELTVETRDRDHAARLVETLEAHGFVVHIV